MQPGRPGGERHDTRQPGGSEIVAFRPRSEPGTEPGTEPGLASPGRPRAGRARVRSPPQTASPDLVTSPAPRTVRWRSRRPRPPAAGPPGVLVAAGRGMATAVTVPLTTVSLTTVFLTTGLPGTVAPIRPPSISRRAGRPSGSRAAGRSRRSAIRRATRPGRTASCAAGHWPGSSARARSARPAVPGRAASGQRHRLPRPRSGTVRAGWPRRPAPMRRPGHRASCRGRLPSRTRPGSRYGSAKPGQGAGGPVAGPAARPGLSGWCGRPRAQRGQVAGCRSPAVRVVHHNQ